MSPTQNYKYFLNYKKKHITRKYTLMKSPYVWILLAGGRTHPWKAVSSIEWLAVSLGSDTSQVLHIYQSLGWLERLRSITRYFTMSSNQWKMLQWLIGQASILYFHYKQWAENFLCGTIQKCYHCTFKK